MTLAREAFAAQALGGGEAGGAAADDDEMPGVGPVASAARRGLGQLLADEDRVAVALHPPDRDRVEGRGAERLAGPEAEAGMVPGAADGVARRPGPSPSGPP